MNAAQGIVQNAYAHLFWGFFAKLLCDDAGKINCPDGSCKVCCLTTTGASLGCPLNSYCVYQNICQCMSGALGLFLQCHDSKAVDARKKWMLLVFPSVW